MAVGGDITEITFNHPTVGSGTLYAKAGEDNSYFIGGIVTDSNEDMIDGGGEPIWQMNRKRGYFEVVVSNDQNVRQDFEKMVAISESPLPAEFTFSIINGTTYGGTGKPVGLSEANINQATFTLRVEGGKFKKVIG